jgi:hypothetical protein
MSILTSCKQIYTPIRLLYHGHVHSNLIGVYICFTGIEYGHDSGKVLITVNVPHQDGMLPVVSTWQPSNFEFILSPDALRQGQHQCSNLLDYSESRPGF